jgi:hypothetical protein
MNKEHQTIYVSNFPLRDAAGNRAEGEPSTPNREMAIEQSAAFSPNPEFVRDSICAAADFSEPFPSILESAEQERREAWRNQ